MRIKHFQGYGTVNAKKVFRKLRSDGKIDLKIEVIGDHECGIARNDTYDVFNWLIKKFDKTVSNYRQIEDMQIDERTVTWNGKPTDCAIYTFLINPYR